MLLTVWLKLFKQSTQNSKNIIDTFMLKVVYIDSQYHYYLNMPPIPKLDKEGYVMMLD